MTTGFILNFTPNGMIPTKSMTPHVPINPQEIITDVLEAAELGANMVHLHARDEEGVPDYKKEIYGEIISGIRKFNKDIILGASTSGRNFPEFEKRSECLELRGDAKPDFGSLTLSSLNFSRTPSVNSPEMIQALATKMKENGIRPELEAFDLGMVNYIYFLEKKGLIAPPYYCNVLLGNIASAQADLASMGLVVSQLPGGTIWSGAGLGDAQLTVNTMALAAGGGVRVGLEDNIYLDSERTQLATNKELVERVVEIGKLLGRSPYSCKEAREIVMS